MDSAMARPASVRHRPLRRTVILGGGARAREYYVRGGVCWPRDLGGRAEGAYVLGGWSVESEQIEIFEEGTFVWLDPIYSAGEIMDPGFARAAGVGWQYYGLREYFSAESEDVYRDMMLACLRCPALRPAPVFTQVPGCDDNTMGRALWAATAAGRLSYTQNGPLHMAIRAHQASSAGGGRLPLPPLLWAAGALVMGLQRWPWRLSKKALQEDDFS